MVPARYDTCCVHFIHTEAIQNTEGQEAQQEKHLGSICEDHLGGKIITLI